MLELTTVARCEFSNKWALVRCGARGVALVVWKGLWESSKISGWRKILFPKLPDLAYVKLDQDAEFRDCQTM